MYISFDNTERRLSTDFDSWRLRIGLGYRRVTLVYRYCWTLSIIGTSRRRSTASHYLLLTFMNWQCSPKKLTTLWTSKFLCIPRKTRSLYFIKLQMASSASMNVPLIFSRRGLWSKFRNSRGRDGEIPRVSYQCTVSSIWNPPANLYFLLAGEAKGRGTRGIVYQQHWEEVYREGDQGNFSVSHASLNCFQGWSSVCREIDILSAIPTIRL